MRLYQKGVFVIAFISAVESNVLLFQHLRRKILHKRAVKPKRNRLLVPQPEAPRMPMRVGISELLHICGFPVFMVLSVRSVTMPACMPVLQMFSLISILD